MKKEQKIQTHWRNLKKPPINGVPKNKKQSITIAIVIDCW